MPRIKWIVPPIVFKVRNDRAHGWIAHTFGDGQAIVLRSVQDLIIIADAHIGGQILEIFVRACAAAVLFTNK